MLETTTSRTPPKSVFGLVIYGDSFQLPVPMLKFARPISAPEASLPKDTLTPYHPKAQRSGRPIQEHSNLALSLSKGTQAVSHLSNQK